MKAREASNLLRVQASQLIDASKLMEKTDPSRVNPAEMIRVTAYLLGLLGEMKLTVARIFDELEPFIANADVSSHIDLNVFERPPMDDEVFRDPE